jgi:hypothetical protein
MVKVAFTTNAVSNGDCARTCQSRKIVWSNQRANNDTDEWVKTQSAEHRQVEFRGCQR